MDISTYLRHQFKIIYDINFPLKV